MAINAFFEKETSMLARQIASLIVLTGSELYSILAPELKQEVHVIEEDLNSLPKEIAAMLCWEELKPC